VRYTVKTTIRGGAGNDVLEDIKNFGSYSGQTVSRIFGDDGADMIRVDDASSFQSGQGSDVAVHGGDGNDRIGIETGIEANYGGGVADVSVYGDDGDDRITVTNDIRSFGRQGSVGTSAVFIRGGDGDDTVFLDSNLNSVASADVSVEVHGDVGRDRIAIINEANSFVSLYNARASSNTFVRGDDGDDIVSVDGIAKTGAAAFVGIELHGDDGDDMMSAVAYAIGAYVPGAFPHAYPYEGSEKSVINLFGDAGDDVLSAIIINGEGASTLVGGTGNDRLTVTGGDDNLLDGGAGNDTLTGSANADTFVLRAGDGTDRVTNFQAGTDVFGLADDLTFADLTIVEAGGNSTIRLASEDLAVVTGVLGLVADDFTVI
jgi:Ca2+-binding RTX toxin-like protein